MIKGIDVTLYERTQTGEDDFGAAVYSETPVTVHNVLVGEPETADLVNELQLYGKRLAMCWRSPRAIPTTGRARRSCSSARSSGPTAA